MTRQRHSSTVMFESQSRTFSGPRAERGVALKPC